MNHECFPFLKLGKLNMEFSRVNVTSSNPHTGKMLIVEDSDIHEIREGGCSSSSMTDSLKETMISQEGVLRKQILELHRLYGIQKNLMEKFHCCKKIDIYSLWNASAQSTFSSENQTRYSFGGVDNDFPAFPMVFSAQSANRTQYNQVLLQKSPIDLQLSVLDQVSVKESSYCDVSTRDPVIDLEEPVDEVSSCIIIQRTSCIQGLDLNKQPEDDNSDTFLNSNSSSTERIDYGNETWQIDLNSTQSEIASCSGNSKCLRRNNTDISISNIMETTIKYVEENGNCKISKSKDESIDEKGIRANESNNDQLSRRVVDLGILEAAESLMAMDNDDGEIQPERSLDSYELIVLNLEECSSISVDECVVSSEEKVKVKEESPIKLRRGARRIKDFRKDVLPSMACLSRHEIQEDVSIMEGVIKSREYKKIMRAKRTNGGGDKLFTPVKKRSRRSKPA